MKNLSLLINGNSTKCFFRNYIKELKYINVNFINLPNTRYVPYNYKKINKHHLYNPMSEFKHYLMNLKKLNGVIMINNECHSDQLLFELGYLFNQNPNLPIFPSDIAHGKRKATSKSKIINNIATK